MSNNFFGIYSPSKVAICAINLPANRRNRLAHSTRPAIDTSVGPSPSPGPNPHPSTTLN